MVPAGPLHFVHCQIEMSSVKNKNPMKRFLHQSDFLPLLLCHSGPGSRCATTTATTTATTATTTTTHRNDPMHRLAISLDNENAVRQFPVYELKELFSALVEECQNDDKQHPSDIVVVDHRPRRSESTTSEPPRKKRRVTSNNNNAHSILRFAERIIRQRYNNSTTKRTKCRNDDDDDDDDEFLETESISYFGTRDALFRAEEDVLCLAFEMALNAIIVRTHGSKSNNETRVVDNNVDNNVDTTHDDNPKFDANDASSTASEGPPKQHHPYRNSEGSSSDPAIVCSVNGDDDDGVINTALRIIDRVILVDKRERTKRHRRPRPSNAKSSSPKENNGTDHHRRKKYEHLLRSSISIPKKQRHESGGRRGKNNGGVGRIMTSLLATTTSAEAIKCSSIMEEKYSERWEWLRKFRTEREWKLGRASEMQQRRRRKQRSHHRDYSFPEDAHEGSSAAENEKSSGSVLSPSEDKKENRGPDDGKLFVIVRRRILAMDDITSPSSTESEDETNDESGSGSARIARTTRERDPLFENTLSEKSPTTTTTTTTTTGNNAASSRTESDNKRSSSASSGTTTTTAPSSSPPRVEETPSSSSSPHDEQLDRETRELRVALLDMPPGESSSSEVVRHAVDEIGELLRRYGEAGGAGGISRCGDIFGGGSRAVGVVGGGFGGGFGGANDAKGEQSKESERSNGRSDNRFPLNDAMVSSLVKAFLTDATGSLRAKAFLRSFVLPLMMDMNPITRAVTLGCSDDVGDQKKGSKCKPASRVLTSLLTSLARDRPAECVESVVVPTLVSKKKYVPSASSAFEASFEPTRFQCELISRLLRGKDALSNPAIALLVEEVLPVIDEETTASDAVPTRGGMKWTENTMPVLTACLNRQPNLPDAVVAKLADEISYCLSPTSPQSMMKSMKFSTLFHVLVSKYGPQLKSAGRVEPLKSSATRLKTFMSKTIGLSLKKLS